MLKPRANNSHCCIYPPICPLSIPLILEGHVGDWSQSQLTLGRRQGTHWGRKQEFLEKTPADTGWTRKLRNRKTSANTANYCTTGLHHWASLLHAYFCDNMVVSEANWIRLSSYLSTQSFCHLAFCRWALKVQCVRCRWKGSIGRKYLNTLYLHQERVFSMEAAMFFSAAQTGQTKPLLSFYSWRQPQVLFHVWKGRVRWGVFSCNMQLHH